MDTPKGELAARALMSILAEERAAKGLSMEEVGERAGLHRTYIGLLERGERLPTLPVVWALADALGVSMEQLVAAVERQLAGPDIAPTPTLRALNRSGGGDIALRRHTGLTHDNILAGIAFAYDTIDYLDSQLALRGGDAMATLFELANFSSMLGNLIGAGIAKASDGRYIRNLPHHYPDLVGIMETTPNIELKMALESNMPKGHLAKPGLYLTIRYVLCNLEGTYFRGSQNRGTVPAVWEVRFGDLGEEAFSVSNTAGDSGKTAVIMRQAMSAMEVVYFDRERCPLVRLPDELRDYR